MHSLQLLLLFQPNNKNASLMLIDCDDTSCNGLFHVMNKMQLDLLLVTKNEALTLALVLDNIKECSPIVLDLCYQLMNYIILLMVKCLMMQLIEHHILRDTCLPSTPY